MGALIRHDRTVASWPDWVPRNGTEHPVLDAIDQWCERHGPAGGFCIPYGIYRKGADGVDP
jgi:hypothetical protein